MTRWDVVYGPPGTGKTTELLRRMKVLQDAGCPPSGFGFFTFTRAAAAEALKRLGLRSNPNMRTLHSLAYEQVGVERAQVVDRTKQREFAQLANLPLSGDDEAPELGDECLALIAFANARMVGIGEAYDMRRPAYPLQVAEYADAAYRGWKKAYGYLDFDDMLRAYVAHGKPLNVKYLFVDEAQDLSPLQWEVLRVAIPGNCLCVTLAGDDDQAIYTWAGAEAQGMRQQSAANGGGKTVVLDQSHRIPNSVHRLATSIAARINDRVEKRYMPRAEEGTVCRWGQPGGIPLGKDALVLYRNHSLRAELEDWLIDKAVPYRTTSGKPSPCDSRYGTAIRALGALRATGNISAAQEKAIRMVLPRQVTTPASEFVRLDWRRDLMIPERLHGYFAHVDHTATPTVTMGTIHSSKGAEADQVVLCDGMGGRTAETLDDHEYRVWYVAVTRARHRLDIVSGDNPFPLME